VTDEPYRVRYTRTARRALSDDLPAPVVHAVLALLDGDLSAEPARVGKPLRPPLSGIWAARRGTYRILYEIDEQEHTVTVVAVEHRGDAYRRP
jgi:mRNA-degrading endonuclease RelE of RelBE toxin-antitoxin system